MEAVVFELFLLCFQSAKDLERLTKAHMPLQDINGEIYNPADPYNTACVSFFVLIFFPLD